MCVRSDSESATASRGVDEAPCLAASALQGVDEAPCSDEAASATSESQCMTSDGDSITQTSASSDSEDSREHAEQFLPSASSRFTSLEQHVKEHALGDKAWKCHLCNFWKNRFTWSAKFAFLDKASGETRPWIACSKEGKVGLFLYT